MRITELGSRHRVGFTLMEVILAMAVSAVVLAAIHSVLYGALRLRNRSASSIDEALPLQNALMIIKRDLAAMVPPGGKLAGELQTDQISTTGLAGQSSPDFYTASGHIDETTPWAEVQKVSYALMPSSNGFGRDLVRVVTRNLLPVLQPESVPQWLLGNVQSIEFFFYDGSQWDESWGKNSGHTNLPAAIKMQIVLGAPPGQRLPAPIELVVPVEAQSLTNQTQTASASSSTGGGQ